MSKMSFQHNYGQGEYTGYKDKVGNKIYGGDICLEDTVQYIAVRDSNNVWGSCQMSFYPIEWWHKDVIVDKSFNLDLTYTEIEELCKLLKAIIDIDDDDAPVFSSMPKYRYINLHSKLESAE